MGALDLSMNDNPSIRGRENRYRTVRVKTGPVLQSWRESLFSFEWLEADGSIRSLDSLPMHERDKRLKVEKHIKDGDILARPVLGIGLLDNVEIGAGRDIFLTLAAQGAEAIEVHVPESNLEDFKAFILR